MAITPELSAENLKKLSDPNRGRIVAAGVSEDSHFIRLFAGMGGTSAGSKNRVYRRVNDLNSWGEYIRTVVYDQGLQTGDPSATLYVAQRCWEGWHVASNGEQTDGIGVVLAIGTRVSESYPQTSFIRAQRLYKNEGLKNRYTARITVAANPTHGYIYMGQIVARPENREDSDYFYTSLDLISGVGYLTATYDGKGEWEPNREPPWEISLAGSLEDNMDAIWNTWDPNSKANLVGKEIERGSGRFRYAVRSIHLGEEQTFHEILL